jgi:hypothetical protein
VEVDLACAGDVMCHLHCVTYEVTLSCYLVSETSAVVCAGG